AVAQVFVEAAQQLPTPVDERRLHAQSREDAGELHGNVASAGDGDPARKLLQMEGVVGRDDVLATHHPSVNVNAGSGGDEDVPSRDGAVFLYEQHFVGTGQLCPLLEYRNARPFQIAPVDALEPGYFAVLGLDQSAPVEPRLAYGPAIPFRILEIVREPAGINQQRLRHATPDDARAAEPVLFRERNPRPMSGRDPGRPHPARATADHEQVEVVLGHVLPRLSGVVRGLAEAYPRMFGPRAQ